MDAAATGVGPPPCGGSRVSDLVDALDVLSGDAEEMETDRRCGPVGLPREITSEGDPLLRREEERLSAGSPPSRLLEDTRRWSGDVAAAAASAGAASTPPPVAGREWPETLREGAAAAAAVAALPPPSMPRYESADESDDAYRGGAAGRADRPRRRCCTGARGGWAATYAVAAEHRGKAEGTEAAADSKPPFRLPRGTSGAPCEGGGTSNALTSAASAASLRAACCSPWKRRAARSASRVRPSPAATCRGYISGRLPPRPACGSPAGSGGLASIPASKPTASKKFTSVVTSVVSRGCPAGVRLGLPPPIAVPAVAPSVLPLPEDKLVGIIALSGPAEGGYRSSTAVGQGRGATSRTIRRMARTESTPNSGSPLPKQSVPAWRSSASDAARTVSPSPLCSPTPTKWRSPIKSTPGVPAVRASTENAVGALARSPACAFFSLADGASVRQEVWMAASARDSNGSSSSGRSDAPVRVR